MRLTCKRAPLLAAFDFLRLALPANKNVKPILNGVLAAAGDGLTLCATDLEVGASVSLRAPVVEEKGAAVLPGEQTHALLRESAAENVLVEAHDGASLRVTTPSDQWDLPAENPAAFPEWPNFPEDQPRHELPAGVLLEMIRRTLFAVAGESGRFSMTGVAWELSADSARLVGSDGYRVSVEERPAAALSGHAPPGRPVVPRKAMSLVAHMLASADPAELASASIRQNDALFRVGASAVYSRLVDGRYPDWSAIWPKKPATTATVWAGDLLAALRRAALTADPADRRMGLAFAAGKLTLSAKSAGRGESRIELPVAWPGKPLALAFTPAYLSEFLRAAPAEATVEIDLIDKETPAVCRVGETWRYLVVTLV